MPRWDLSVRGLTKEKIARGTELALLAFGRSQGTNICSHPMTRVMPILVPDAQGAGGLVHP
jgi:hypothetical protein